MTITITLFREVEGMLAISVLHFTQVTYNIIGSFQFMQRQVVSNHYYTCVIVITYNLSLHVVTANNKKNYFEIHNQLL